MKPLTLHCPQCGLDSPGVEQHAQPCPGCQTLIVHVGSGTLEALRFGGHHLPAEGHTVALVCRTCGGTLPEEEVAGKAPTKVRCGYCGCKANLPDVLGLLRLAVTRPSALPSTTRRFFMAWGSVMGLFLITVIYHAMRPSPRLDVDQYLVMQAGEPSDTVNGVQRYALHARSSSITVLPRGNHFIHATVAADELKDTHLRLHVTAVQEATRARHEMVVSLWNGAVIGGEKFDPPSHPYSDLPLGDGLRPATWPPGRYHLLIEGATVQGAGPLPAQVRVEWSSWHSPGHGWLIFAANILIWSFAFGLLKMGRDPLEKRRVVNASLILAGIASLIVFIHEIHPLPGLYDRGQFTISTVPKP